MKSGGRQLRLEQFETRAVLAAQEFLTFDAPLANLAANSSPNTSSVAGSIPRHRQLSVVVDNAIETTGLHPQGTSLGTNSQSMTSPSAAVDAVIEKAWDADTGIGYAVFEDGRTEAVLWIDANLSVLLGNSVPLAGYQRPDASVVMAFESNNTVRVVHYSASGQELNSVALDGEIYSNAKAAAGGLVLLGTENDLPVAAWVDENLVVTETSLTLPAGSTFATAVGVSLSGGQRFYTGSSIDAAGESRVILWDLQGNLVPINATADLWTIRASGHAILVDADQGYGVLLRDAALANLFGVAVDTPMFPADLAILQARNFASVTFTDVIQQGNEIFLSVLAMDAQGGLIYGVIAASLSRFPSPWQFVPNPLDVNTSGFVSPIDALLVINELNSTGARLLSASDLSALPRWDVNADGSISAIDALLVINHLNSQPGSGEAGSAQKDASAAPLLHAAIDVDLLPGKRRSRESGLSFVLG